MTTEAVTDPEDRKIMTLARAAQVRTGASQGACVRDIDGRTYAATSVQLFHLQLTGIQLAVAMAVSSGAAGLEAVALVSDVPASEDDLALVRELPGGGVKFFHSDVHGRLLSDRSL